MTDSKFVARIFGPSDLIESDFEKFEKVKFKLRQIAQVRLEWMEYIFIRILVRENYRCDIYDLEK